MEEAGRVIVWKVPSTPTNAAEAIVEGLRQSLSLAEQNEGTGSLSYFGHGTTVATNALIQLQGSPTALVTTKGFRDIIELARQRRPHLYDLQVDKPEMIIPRHLRFEVSERVRYDGSVETPLDEEELRRLAVFCREKKIAAVSICFLFSYKNPIHERRAADIFAEVCPGLFLTTSHGIAPEFREYERFSTAVVNSYLGPVMKTYLEDLEPRLSDLGFSGATHVTQSNGGTLTSSVAAAEPVRTLLSGPATGVTGALAVARQAGVSNFITFDMGGTSTDVSLIENGKPTLGAQRTVNGYPLKMPMLDIHTVGAGGGSIAYVDNGGLIKVGPQSAGAAPGPACYGAGGLEPTVCDANVVLGTLDVTSMLGGRLKASKELAEAAITNLATRLRLQKMETAQGVVSVVVANMARAIRLISVQRGLDPREFTLVAFGGAGPLHAARLMQELEVPRVLIPRHPGLLCAMGLLMADLKRNDSITAHLKVERRQEAAIQGMFHDLQEKARRWFAIEQIDPTSQHIARSVDARYVGQNHELSILLPEDIGPQSIVDVVQEAFHTEHERVFGFKVVAQDVELVTFRTEATARVPKVSVRAHEPAQWSVDASLIGVRDVWFGEQGDYLRTRIYDRDRVGPGHLIVGPDFVQQWYTSVLIPPMMIGRVDQNLNIIVEVQQ
jgi:N-methylhydantoinase A